MLLALYQNKKDNFRLGFLILAFLLLVPFYSNAQNSCSQQLEEAEKLFDSGQIDQVESLLKSCLENGFTKNEKARAYRLLTLCNLYYNQDKEAEKTFLELLKVDKEYKIKKSDPTEFVSLHQEFRTNPVFITGVKFGAKLNDIYNVDYYNDINSILSSSVYESDNTYSFGLSFESPIWKDISLVYEFYYSSLSYSYKNTVLDYAEVTFKENISGLDIPVLLQWNFLKGDLVPYINAGASFSYLLKSEGDYTRRDNDGTLYREPLESTLDLTDSRNKFNYAICAGAGFRWKNLIGYGYLTFDIRYARYLNNHVDYENRANNEEMMYSYLISDNPLKTQNMQFIIGYKLPFYIPKHKSKK